MRKQQMRLELVQLEEKTKKIQKQLKNLPRGKLICTQNGKYSKWYHNDGHSTIYLPKKNKDMAEKLAVKKYLDLQLKDIRRQKEAIKRYLDSQADGMGEADTLLMESSAFSDLLKPYFEIASEEYVQWATASYNQNTNYPEHLIHKSPSGHVLRSKSEVMIDMQLYTHKIPFRYESALELCGTTIYPDFTIRHPKTGEEFYWEHFGMMDDTTYSKNVCAKLELYISNNIIPDINLITTYETKEHPLGMDLIDSIIKHFFL